jgi:hypothetical protein
MTSASTYFTPPAPTYVTPIKCPHCDSEAHLIRRSPAVTADGHGEIRTFECFECHERTEMFIGNEIETP